MFVCHIPIIPGILQNFLLLYIFIIFDIKDFVVCVAINNIKIMKNLPFDANMKSNV